MLTKLQALDELLRLNKSPSQVSAADFLEALQNRSDTPFLVGSWASPALSAAIRRYMVRPDVDAEEAVRLLHLSADLRSGRYPVVTAVALEHLQAWWQAHAYRVDLLGLSRFWKGQPQEWFLAFQDRSWNVSWPRLEAAFLTPYLSQHLDYLLGSLGVPGWLAPPPHPADWSAGPTRALKLLPYLPSLPEAALERLWQLALGEARVERELAQKCLTQRGPWEQRLLQSVRLSQAGPRQRAAEWAGRARLQAALPLLTGALQKEKVEKCRLAQMDALKLLGAPLETYLNREGLLREARAQLQRATPPWLGQLPTPLLHWSDGQQAVEVELLQGLALGAVKLKSPEPSAWLKTICQNLALPGRHLWGKALLEAWIAADLAGRLSDEQVEARLPDLVKTLRELYQMLGQPRTPAALESEARRQLTHQVEGSAIDLKGLLALAGACGGVELVAIVQNYLKQWYGLRAAQCKALVAMLAHAEELEAVQFLLGVARRFRTRGIQEEAQRRLRERAERLGWTLEDMADLSLPDAGLEADGTLRLDLGDREVAMKLQADLSWSPKTLPNSANPNEQVQAALKTWKAAQKTVKEVFKSLALRLYDAMCCGRQWTFASWETCLLQHPLARRSCQALVWQAQGLSFRPSEDGSLIDVDHGLIQPEPDWTITLAHPLHLGEERVAAWSSHLADYQLVQPFAQLSRPVHPKPAEPQSELQGHMLTSFALRNRAKALGYERGPAEDGGVFFEYRKTLGTSGWAIRVQFTGSELPETLHPVALQTLAFDYQAAPAELAQVPPVLWSEAYNDGLELSRAGSGFDPEWEQKVTLR